MFSPERETCSRRFLNPKCKSNLYENEILLLPISDPNLTELKPITSIRCTIIKRKIISQLATTNTTSMQSLDSKEIVHNRKEPSMSLQLEDPQPIHVHNNKSLNHAMGTSTPHKTIDNKMRNSIN